MNDQIIVGTAGKRGMTEEEAVEIAKTFCDPDRTGFEGPLVICGMLYASNGHVAIRMRTPAGTPDSATNSRVNFNSKNVWSMYDQSGRWMPWPDPDYEVGRVDCGTCKGTGRLDWNVCPKCDGKGSTECGECGANKTCEKCDGEGSLSSGQCPDCQGQTKIQRPKYQPIGGTFINVKYDKLIRALPGAELLENPERPAMSAIPFRFEGGEGLVMPMRR